MQLDLGLHKVVGCYIWDLELQCTGWLDVISAQSHLFAPKFQAGSKPRHEHASAPKLFLLAPKNTLVDSRKMTKEANMKKTSTFRVFFWSRGGLGLGELEGWLCKFGGGGPAARAAASRYGARGARQRQN